MIRRCHHFFSWLQVVHVGSPFGCTFLKIFLNNTRCVVSGRADTGQSVLPQAWVYRQPVVTTTAYAIHLIASATRARAEPDDAVETTFESSRRGGEDTSCYLFNSILHPYLLPRSLKALSIQSKRQLLTKVIDQTTSIFRDQTLKHL